MPLSSWWAAFEHEQKAIFHVALGCWIHTIYMRNENSVFKYYSWFDSHSHMCLTYHWITMTFHSHELTVFMRSNCVFSPAVTVTFINKKSTTTYRIRHSYISSLSQNAPKLKSNLIYYKMEWKTRPLNLTFHLWRKFCSKLSGFQLMQNMNGCLLCQLCLRNLTFFLCDLWHPQFTVSISLEYHYNEMQHKHARQLIEMLQMTWCD